ncbi:hypothetical protein L917_06958, partial [Phytophthora nicotianae]
GGRCLQSVNAVTTRPRYLAKMRPVCMRVTWDLAP